jgi:hypothetical protein
MPVKTPIPIQDYWVSSQCKLAQKYLRKGIPMTIPMERTRALRWAGEFLHDMASSPELSDALQQEAKRILRHYPSAQEIQHAAFTSDVQRLWLAPEDKEA